MVGTMDSSGQDRGSHINVSRLGGNDERADGVLVVFCAPRPNSKTTLVVGWYENTAVLREPQKRGWGPGLYNIVSRKATLLAEPKRSFEVPRAQRDGYGLGQANVYYPDAGRDRRWLSHLLGHVASPDAKPGRSPRKRASKGRPQQSDPEIRMDGRVAPPDMSEFPEPENRLFEVTC